ncbi:hypothetical protein F4818DRAFT_389726 [Hypoxylon cercidicola]|nr:hypothetical protein F4818DRAFT_389726 [Hypoxylon cercidicola]
MTHDTLAGGTGGEQYGDPMSEKGNLCTTADNEQDPMKASQPLDELGIPSPSPNPIDTARVDHAPLITIQSEPKYEKTLAPNDKKGISDAGALYTKASGTDSKTLEEVDAESVSHRLETLLEGPVAPNVEGSDLPEPTPNDSQSKDTHLPRFEEDNISIEPMELRECSVSPNYSCKVDSQSTESRDSSIDSDLLSISDDSDDLEPLCLEDGIYLELITLVIGIVVGNPGEATSGQSSTQTRAGPAASNSGYTHPNTALRGSGSSWPSKKRRRVQKNNEHSDDDEPSQPPSRGVSKSDTWEGRPRSLACPFAKMDPVRHVACFSKKLSRVRDVKQHLHRKHTPGFYCNRCKAIFPNEASLQEHVGQAPGLFCEPSALLDGISPAQRQQLSRKSDPKRSVEEQWYSMWDIIFPGHNRPSTVYVVFGFSDDLCSYREFSTGSRMAESVVEGLRDSGIDVPDGIRDAVHRIVADRVDSSFDRWLSNRFTYSMTLSDTSSSNLQRTSTQVTRQDTPVSSESSRTGPRYQGAVDESQNCPRPNAEVVLHQQRASDQGAHERQFVPIQNTDPTLPLFEDFDSRPWNDPFTDQGYAPGIVSFGTLPDTDISSIFHFGEPETGHQATQPDS